MDHGDPYHDKVDFLTRQIFMDPQSGGVMDHGDPYHDKIDCLTR